MKATLTRSKKTRSDCVSHVGLALENKRAPYTRWACTSCRKKKLKCKNENDGQTPCERCSRLGLSCVYEQRRRGRRSTHVSSQTKQRTKSFTSRNRRPHSSALALDEDHSNSSSSFQLESPSSSFNLRPRKKKSNMSPSWVDDDDDTVYNPSDDEIYQEQIVNPHQNSKTEHPETCPTNSNVANTHQNMNIHQNMNTHQNTNTHQNLHFFANASMTPNLNITNIHQNTSIHQNINSHQTITTHQTINPHQNVNTSSNIHQNINAHLASNVHQPINTNPYSNTLEQPDQLIKHDYAQLYQKIRSQVSTSNPFDINNFFSHPCDHSNINSVRHNTLSPQTPDPLKPSKSVDDESLMLERENACDDLIPTLSPSNDQPTLFDECMFHIPKDPSMPFGSKCAMSSQKYGYNFTAFADNVNSWGKTSAVPPEATKVDTIDSTMNEYLTFDISANPIDTSSSDGSSHSHHEDSSEDVYLRASEIPHTTPVELETTLNNNHLILKLTDLDSYKCSNQFTPVVQPTIQKFNRLSQSLDSEQRKDAIQDLLVVLIHQLKDLTMNCSSNPQGTNLK